MNLVKEDNRLSEQTLLVDITIGPPAGNIAAAIPESLNEFGDYSIPGNLMVIQLPFVPQLQSLEWRFFINGDDVLEGIEAFQASSTSSTNAEFPLFQSPQSDMVHQNTEIQIIDYDGERELMHIACSAYDNWSLDK